MIILPIEALGAILRKLKDAAEEAEELGIVLATDEEAKIEQGGRLQGINEAIGIIEDEIAPFKINFN